MEAINQSHHTVIELEEISEAQPNKHSRWVDYAFYAFTVLGIIAILSIVSVQLHRSLSVKDGPFPLDPSPMDEPSSPFTKSGSDKQPQFMEGPAIEFIPPKVSMTPPETKTDEPTTIEHISTVSSSLFPEPTTINPPIILTDTKKVASTLASNEPATETSITTTTDMSPMPLTMDHDRTTHYTKLDFAADEWYKPIHSLLNAPATYEEAEKICKTPLMIGEVKHDQTLPSVHMYEELINKVVEKMPDVYGGKAMWTGLYTYSAKISDLGDVKYAWAYGPPDDKGRFFMMHNPQSFCAPFNDQPTAQQLWNAYKVKYLKEKNRSVIRFVKDFTHSNKPKTSWPTGWFPGCLRPYDSATDPKELNFVCQTNFLEPKDIENWSPPSQTLPFHLNRMKITKQSGRRGRNVRKMPSSNIDIVLPTLQLIPVFNQMPTLS